MASGQRSLPGARPVTLSLRKSAPASYQQDYRRSQPPAPGRPVRIPAAADDVALAPGHADILAPPE
jgi:hypothetical protein